MLSPNEVQYGAPSAAEHDAVRAMARQCFADTFAHLYAAAPFAEFLEAAYGEDGSMVRDLADRGIDWLVARVDGGVVGYAKVRKLGAPAPDPRPNALELQQIYVLRGWHGRGVAERLMMWAIDRARERGATELYLTVFDHNERAKRFYARHGFSEVSHCTFQLGDRVDDDRVWRKVL